MAKSGLDTRWTDHLRKASRIPKENSGDAIAADPLIPTSDDPVLDKSHLQPSRGFEADAINKDGRQQAAAKRSKVSTNSSPTSPDSAATLGTPSHKRSAPADENSKAQQGNYISNLGRLSIDNKSDSPIQQDAVMDESTSNQPRKRAAIGEGLADRSPSTSQQGDSHSHSPRRSRAKPKSTPQGSVSKDMPASRQPHSLRGTPGPGTSGVRGPVAGKTLFNPQTNSSFVKTSQAQNQSKTSHNTNQSLQRGSMQTTRNINTVQRPPSTHASTMFSPTILSKNSSAAGSSAGPELQMMLQPQTRPISQEQLIAEVKGIYAGLVMVEQRCIEVDAKHAAAAGGSVLTNDQWQALIALHRTLLHEHHDFFLASQHPSASPALRKLATKYAMPARMWKHGIHSFLELLRHRLPMSLDHMLAFIYLAYSMMALLYETVPAFEDTWIECLGDLGRYRMAIEDDDIRDREVWTNVARHWYSKASDKSPTTGRLYHHLAILARPNVLQQIFFYSKSLSVTQLFPSARESVLTLFDPALKASQAQSNFRTPTIESTFIKVHAALFTGRRFDQVTQFTKDFTDLLDNHIGRVTRNFMQQGYYIAVANSVALLSFGADDNPLNLCMASKKGEDDKDAASTQQASEEAMQTFAKAQALNYDTLAVVLERIGDPNVLPYLHVSLVFMLHMASVEGAKDLLAHTFPWVALSKFLNSLVGAPQAQHSIGPGTTFPVPHADDVRPFPEDWAMCGLLWTANYFPKDWFSNPKIEDEEKYHEKPSMTSERKDRILYIACSLVNSSFADEIQYDQVTRRFSSKKTLEENDMQSEDMVRQMSIDSVTEGARSIDYGGDMETPLRSDTLPTAITDAEETDEPLEHGVGGFSTIVQEPLSISDTECGESRMEDF